jgi:hypothetical protein
MQTAPLAICKRSIVLFIFLTFLLFSFVTPAIHYLTSHALQRRHNGERPESGVINGRYDLISLSVKFTSNLTLGFLVIAVFLTFLFLSLLSKSWFRG